MACPFSENNNNKTDKTMLKNDEDASQSSQHVKTQTLICK